MANITKFKDKKTGEVYDLGPKTWEITLTSDDFESMIRDEVPLSGVEGGLDMFENAKAGDIAIVKTSGGGVVVKGSGVVSVLEILETKMVAFSVFVEGNTTIVLSNVNGVPTISTYNM